MVWHADPWVFGGLWRTHHLIPAGQEVGVGWVHEYEDGTACWEAGGRFGVVSCLQTAQVRAERAVGYRRRPTPPQGARVRPCG